MIFMPKIKIFVSHRIDQDNITFENDIYTPVRCGAVYDKNAAPEIIGDNTGKNISDKRPFLGEFTVQYWAWKNVEADYYGLCHYRRYLSFSKVKYPTDEKNQIIEKKLTKHSFEKYNLTNTKYIEEEVSKYDAVVAEYSNISGMYTPKGPRPTVYEHFAAYDNHLISKNDIDLFLKTVAKLYPDMKELSEEYFNGSNFRGFNCFILKKDLFSQLCEMEVEILRSIEKSNEIDFTYRSDLQSRTYGFFTEWIYGLFIYSLEKKNKKIKYTQLVFFEQTAKPTYIIPQENAIPVVFETNRWLLPATTVTIQSIIDNRNAKNKYEFIICHSELSKFEQSTVTKHFESNNNVSVKFVDLKSTTPICDNGIYWDYEHKSQHFVYILPWVLKKYKRIIYLHSDTVVNTDLSSLFNMNLEGNEIAAPRDFLRISEHRKDSQLYQFRKYKLSMKDPYEYFSSAVVLFDLELIRKTQSVEDCVRFSMGNYYHMDIMNRLYYGNVKLLDSRWNAIIETVGSLKLLSEYMPKSYLDELHEAQKEPAIIHYLSYPKPWQNPNQEMAVTFWQIARKTPFYERLIQNLVFQMSPQNPTYYPQPIIKEKKIITLFKKILPKQLHPFAKKIKKFLKL